MTGPGASSILIAVATGLVVVVWIVAIVVCHQRRQPLLTAAFALALFQSVVYGLLQAGVMLAASLEYVIVATRPVLPILLLAGVVRLLPPRHPRWPK